ncbi:divergent polysaccharide deacetylase family protein [Candidatus Marinimicrobia bacterium]|nr:divergent polysaccharide deacetylase family protein [Candidatus Neomarinimicrobiota bacterium]
MKKIDLKTPMIYFLMIIIVILLIVLKKMDDQANKINQDNVKEIHTQEIEKIKKVEEEKKIDKKETSIGLRKIAIVIDDFGYRNDDVSDGFLKINANLTYAIIPGHNYSTSFGEKAANAGYEVIVHMPMENTGKTYGEEKFVLMTDMDSETIKRRINNAFFQIPTAIGMNNHQGSKASADQHVMSNVAKVIKEKGLFFLDSRTTVETVIVTTMEVFGVPTAKRNIFLDNEDSELEIRTQLEKLVKKAERDGSSIGIGHAKRKTLSVLEAEIPKLQKRGFKFVFVSEMVR